nr:putative glutamate--cysteine ligase regulatory subunit [Quercus suber]
MQLILSTSNIMAAGPAIRPASSSKSNAEFISSLRTNLQAHYLQNHNDGDLADTTNGNLSTSKLDYTSWTKQTGDNTLQIPALDFSESALQENREQYDITLKLFYLPGTAVDDRERYTRAALDLVLQELHMSSIDLLILSFPGIYFDEEEDCPSKISTRGPIEADPENIESQIETWGMLEKFHEEGLVTRLGVAEFGHDRLRDFMERTKLRPSVDQINLRDCCSVPKDLMALAKGSNIELLVHNDCSNILPRGTLRELLGSGAGILADSTKTGEKRKDLHDDKARSWTALQGEVMPKWVVKYTAVVKNRGVVENKGYFACAELKQ